MASAIVLIAGCSEIEPVSEPSPGSGPPAPRVEVVGLEHDFGTVLARGQGLDHDFVLENPGDRPAALRAFAHTPCCSEVGPVPAAIAPRESASLPTRWRLKPVAGLQRVVFGAESQTEEGERIAWDLALRARVLPEVEVEEVDGSSRASLGQAGRWILRVTCRRLNGEGRDLPDSIEGGPPLAARWTGGPTTTPGPDGLIEAARLIEVDRPAVAEPGQQSASILLRWADGSKHEHPLRWEVVPHIRASPSGLLVARDRPTVATVVLRCDGLPFRVIGVDGPASSPTPSQLPAQAQSLRLEVDPADLNGQSSADVVIATDHPDQPTVLVSLLVTSIPTPAEATP